MNAFEQLLELDGEPMYFDDPDWEEYSYFYDSFSFDETSLIGNSLRTAAKILAALGIIVSLIAGGVKAQVAISDWMTPKPPVECRLSLAEYIDDFNSGKKHYGEWVTWEAQFWGISGTTDALFYCEHGAPGEVIGFYVEPKEWPDGFVQHDRYRIRGRVEEFTPIRFQLVDATIEHINDLE